MSYDFETNHKGLATLEDIKPGAVLYHVYGKLSDDITEYKIHSAPTSYEVMMRMSREKFTPGDILGDSMWVFVENERGYFNWISLRDCGIGGKYNYNRLCTSYKSAHQYYRLVQKQLNKTRW